jgi:hypothetical protein
MTDCKGPFAGLLTKIDGESIFTPAGTGTRITVRYNIFPGSRLAASALPTFRSFWRNYARQMRAELSDGLVT